MKNKEGKQRRRIKRKNKEAIRYNYKKLKIKLMNMYKTLTKQINEKRK